MPRADADSLTEEALLSHMARLPHGRASFKQLARELGVKGPGKSGLDDTL
ncbi:MAG: hypothetical protein H7039_06465, partial [Bryobacteraceae bacterium]|nr:hypothetical protein [Bryobacteraceae bacterium]